MGTSSSYLGKSHFIKILYLLANKKVDSKTLEFFQDKFHDEMLLSGY